MLSASVRTLLLLAWLNIFFSNCRNLFRWQCYFIKRWILLLISQHATRDTSVMGVKKPPAKDCSLGLKKIIYQWLGDNWQLQWRYIGSSSDNMFWCNISTCFCLLSNWLTAYSTRAVLCITMYATECWGWGTTPHLFCCRWWAAQLSQGVSFVFSSAKMRLLLYPSMTWTWCWVWTWIYLLFLATSHILNLNSCFPFVFTSKMLLWSERFDQLNLWPYFYQNSRRKIFKNNSSNNNIIEFFCF